MNNNKSTILARCFSGHGNAPEGYQAYRPMEGVQGYDRRVTIVADIYESGHVHSGFPELFHCQPTEKGALVMSRPLITIGVCHNKLTGMS
jgi:hypothetical protein